MTDTYFKYRCECGHDGTLLRETNAVRCPTCHASLPIIDDGIIDFYGRRTNQNDYFDKLYAADQNPRDAQTDDYPVDVNRSANYFILSGLDPAKLIDNRVILEVACGSGLVTAGILANKNVRNCRLHAFDISAEGVAKLARFNTDMKSDNVLELSVQDAQSMRFSPSTFDLVIGSSVLHHFDDVPSFLSDCRRILKPEGIAIFGEPFAIGYSLGVAALRIAQRQLSRNVPQLDALYNDIKFRIGFARDKDALRKLVDKHLFFQAELQAIALAAGFRSVEYVSFAPREYYPAAFIADVLREHGVVDQILVSKAKEIYEVIFDIFDSDNFVNSLSSFIQVVLRG